MLAIYDYFCGKKEDLTSIPKPEKEETPVNMEEDQYLNLIRHIFKDGHLMHGRNGNVYSIFGYMMRYSLYNGRMPLLTTKKVAWKTCFRELMWFLKGSTNNAELVEKGVHIWDQNASREFLDQQGLSGNEVNDLGPVYGHQWRHFNAEYFDNQTNYSGKGIDQIAHIIKCLKDPETRNSRRLILTAWNPCQLGEMALPPCHLLCQFHVQNDRFLSCALYQRSGDVGLGVPFNIASYAFLTHLIAFHTGLEAGEFVHFIGDAHIYEDHMDALREQIQRTPLVFPKIRVFPAEPRKNIEDYVETDIQWLESYVSCPALKMDMVA